MRIVVCILSVCGAQAAKRAEKEAEDAAAKVLLPSVSGGAAAVSDGTAAVYGGSAAVYGGAAAVYRGRAALVHGRPAAFFGGTCA
eukprot:2700683-Rhodomonas_salina.1